MKMTPQERGYLGYLASKEIHRKKYLKRVEKYKENPTICTHCKKPLDYKIRSYKFCGQTCSATYNNIKRGNINPTFCLNCNKKIPKSRKYCNHSCQKSYEWKKRKEKIESTKSFGKNDIVGRKTSKKYFIEKYGNKCQICGCTEWIGKPILLLADHIDGDHRNNSINNLRIICSNCDSTLDTYKNRNKNKGRENRWLCNKQKTLTS